MEKKIKYFKDRIEKNNLNKIEIDEFLVNIIEDATRKAFEKLFKDYDENFYYCSLLTTGEGLCPVISAFSEEALDREVLNIIKTNIEKDIEEEKKYLRWSYADSPYYAYGYEEYFLEIKDILIKRKEVIKKNRSEKKVDEMLDNEINLIINSMEKAMSNLDKEGLFGKGENRNNVFIAVEFMPPDPTNIIRAIRLNKEENKEFKHWFKEEAELEVLDKWLNELELN